MLLCLSLLALAALAGCGGANVNVNTANTRAASTNSYNSMNTNTAPSVTNMSNSMANSNSSSASSDTDFIKEAAMGGMAEVELGRLAASKATNAEVKKFGQMMVEDHSKANADLKTLAAKKNVTLPTELDGDKKSTLEELRGETGAEFDKEYVEEMVDDHEEDVAAFEKQAQNATDPDVKAFAAKTLPVLKKHLDAIKAIQAKMK
jgi:putative membrane protein